MFVLFFETDCIKYSAKAAGSVYNTLFVSHVSADRCCKHTQANMGLSQQCSNNKGQKIISYSNYICIFKIFYLESRINFLIDMQNLRIGVIFLLAHMHVKIWFLQAISGRQISSNYLSEEKYAYYGHTSALHVHLDTNSQ